MQAPAIQENRAEAPENLPPLAAVLLPPVEDEAAARAAQAALVAFRRTWSLRIEEWTWILSDGSEKTRAFAVIYAEAIRHFGEELSKQQLDLRAGGEAYSNAEGVLIGAIRLAGPVRAVYGQDLPDNRCYVLSYRGYPPQQDLTLDEIIAGRVGNS